jgi:hypothetical protein
MPVTCGKVIERALRRLGVLAAGEVVTGSDEQVGIEALQEIIDGMRSGLFGRMQDLLSDSDMTAKAFDRIISTNLTGITVTFPTQDESGDPLRDGDVVEIRDLYSDVVFNYRWNADVARWVAVTGITPADDLPIGDKFTGAAVALLATRLAGEFGVPVSLEIMRDASAGARAIARSKDRRQDWYDQDILN